jgi:hypothetical protein
MRVPYLSLFALLGLYIAATAPGHTDARAPATAGDRVLASGATFALEAANFCALPQHRARSTIGEKQRLENHLQREVCSGKMPIREARAAVSGNSFATYRKYLGAP